MDRGPGIQLLFIEGYRSSGSKPSLPDILDLIDSAIGKVVHNIIGVRMSLCIKSIITVVMCIPKYMIIYRFLQNLVTIIFMETIQSDGVQSCIGVIFGGGGDLRGHRPPHFSLFCCTINAFTTNLRLKE